MTDLNVQFLQKIKSGYWIVLMILLLRPLLFGKQAFGQSISNDRPNIIFILVDDLGWKDLGVYGSRFYESPNIDKLANEGMLFTDAYASSTVCSPSRSGIMTGRNPVRTGITDWIIGLQNTKGPQPNQKLLPQQFSFNLDTSEVTIAEALKAAGYATCYSGKWHLGLTPEYWPLNQGFDYNYGGWAAGNPWSGGMGGYFSPYHNPRLSDGPKGEFLTDRLTTETIKFIKNETKKRVPFFAFLSFYAVHERIQAKEKYIQRFKQKSRLMGLDSLTHFIRDSSETHSGWMPILNERIVQDNPIYAGLIYSVDENVGRIMKTLKELGEEKNTILVFTSDNGGLSTTRNAPTTNYPLRYGKGWTFEGGTRVPLIIKWPGKIHSGTECHFPVINTDLYPTFLEMAGLPLMAEQHVDGVSMVPLLKGKNSINQPDIFWHYPHYHGGGGVPSSAVREGDWKLIQYYEDSHIELYNLRMDIEERRNLAHIFPQRAAHMLALLNDWKRRVHAKIPSLNPYYNPNYAELIKSEGITRRQFMKRYDSLFDKNIFDPNLSKSIREREKQYLENK